MTCFKLVFPHIDSFKDMGFNRIELEVTEMPFQWLVRISIMFTIVEQFKSLLFKNVCRHDSKNHFHELQKISMHTIYWVILSNNWKNHDTCFSQRFRIQLKFLFRHKKELDYLRIHFHFKTHILNEIVREKADVRHTNEKLTHIKTESFRRKSDKCFGDVCTSG